METIVKSFTGMFFVLLLTCLGLGLIEASVEAREADRFVAKAVAEIEAGHYSDKVISEVKAEAQKRAEAEGRTFDLNVSIAKNSDYEPYGTAKLKYEYRLPVIGLSQMHTITADIR